MTDTKELKIVSALQIACNLQVRHNIHICITLIVQDILHFHQLRDLQFFSHFKISKIEA